MVYVQFTVYCAMTTMQYTNHTPIPLTDHNMTQHISWIEWHDEYAPLQHHNVNANGQKIDNWNGNLSNQPTTMTTNNHFFIYFYTALILHEINCFLSKSSIFNVFQLILHSMNDERQNIVFYRNLKDIVMFHKRKRNSL